MAVFVVSSGAKVSSLCDNALENLGVIFRASRVAFGITLILVQLLQ